MHLVPTQAEVMELLRQTGGLRKGHFEYPNGLHTNEYLQVALTMRHYQSAKILSVGLSRLIRAHADLRAMIPELSIVAPATGGPACLSERERGVLALVARGLNNTEVAEALGLSPLTAKTHVSRIMGKLGARDRAQLVIVAYESGMVTPGRL